MCLDALSLLPKCLHSGLLCATLHSSDNSPEITTYHSNGYIYEVKNKQIIGSLYVKKEKISSLSVYYLKENDVLVRYYLALTASNVLLVIRGINNSLQVIQTFNNVQQVKVFDFKFLGYPQLQIYFFEALEAEVFDFSTSGNFQIPIVNHIKTSNSCLSTVKNCMIEKLSIMNIHIEELNNENISIRKNINESEISNECDKCTVLGPVKFSLQQEKKEKLNLTLFNQWHKHLGKFWVFGTRIFNNSQRFVPDLQLLINEKKVKYFTYCFFSMTGVVECPSNVPSIVQPEQDVIMVGAFQMPDFAIQKEMSIKCILTSLSTGNNVKMNSIESNSWDVLSRYKTELTAQDIIAIMTSHIEIKAIIQSQTDEENLLESIFGQMGFKEINLMKTKFFYCTSNEIGVLLKQISVSPLCCNLFIYTSNYFQLYLLVNALYDVLPEKTKILHCNESQNY